MSEPNDALLRRLGALARGRRAVEQAVPVPESTTAERALIEARLRDVLRSTGAPPPAVTVRSRRIAHAAWVGLPLLAAAAAVLLFGPHAAPHELPAYGLEVAISAALRRGTPPDRARAPTELRVRAGALTSLVLRPELPVRWGVDVHVFQRRGQQLRPIEAQLGQDDLGSVRVQFDWPAGPPVAGSELVILVGAPGLNQQRLAELLSGPPARGPGFQRWVLTLTE